MRLIGLHLFAGDMPAGERGLVSWPGREQEFADSVAAAARIGRRLGCRAYWPTRAVDAPAASPRRYATPRSW
ncbi:hypothetical protein [Nocardia sp. BMG51109]|uniref:hypothetical protein n=1 Tax=Nocardia sp. BMG51109 TaxID=1056816 RepID=UPI0004B1994E|nr:hypothetical protein [Nocardia sp. BMG51109]